MPGNSFSSRLCLCLALLCLVGLASGACGAGGDSSLPGSAAPTAVREAGQGLAPSPSPGQAGAGPTLTLPLAGSPTSAAPGPTPTLPLPSLTPALPDPSPGPSPILPDPTPSATPAQPEPAACGWPPERVLIVSVDSLRVDAITGTLPLPFEPGKASAPFLLELSQKAAYTWSAQTVWPSLTLPAHTSLLTGYDVPYHHVDSNAYFKDPGGQVPLPTIFARAREKGLITAMLAGKKYFYFFQQAEFLDFSWVSPSARDSQIAAQAVNYILAGDFHLMLVHLANVDEAGHAHGWMSPAYLARVAKADRAVQEVFAALEQKGIAGRTLFIVLSDHGGSSFTHSDAGNPVNRTIPWMAVGPCVRPGHRLAQDVRIYDTAVTAMWALDIPYPADIDGVPVWEAFEAQLQPASAMAANRN